jgi:hypothetical protein
MLVIDSPINQHYLNKNNEIILPKFRVLHD